MPHGGLDINAHGEYIYFVLTVSTRTKVKRKEQMKGARQAKTYTLRMPEEVRLWAVERAQMNDRSMNGEIVAILKALMNGDKREQAA